MKKQVEYLDAISFKNVDFDSFCAWRYQEEVEAKFDESARKEEKIKSEKDILEEEGDDFRMEVFWQIYEEADNGELSEIVGDDFNLFYFYFYNDNNMAELDEIMKWYCANLS